MVHKQAVFGLLGRRTPSTPWDGVGNGAGIESENDPRAAFGFGFSDFHALDEHVREALLLLIAHIFEAIFELAGELLQLFAADLVFPQVRDAFFGFVFLHERGVPPLLLLELPSLVFHHVHLPGNIRLLNPPQPPVRLRDGFFMPVQIIDQSILARRIFGQFFMQAQKVLRLVDCHFDVPPYPFFKFLGRDADAGLHDLSVFHDLLPPVVLRADL